MAVYNLDAIIKVDFSGITFRDNNNSEQVINFSECRSNWVKQVNKSKSLVRIDGNKSNEISEEDTNCVGIRNSISEKPYFEFCAHEIIRFEINHKKFLFDKKMKRSKQESYKKFSTFRNQLNEMGWSTFDLS